MKVLIIFICLGFFGCTKGVSPSGEGRYPEVFIAYDTALEFYKNDFGGYPAQKLGLADLYFNVRSSPKWHGPYLKSVSGLDSVFYRSIDGGRDYELFLVKNDGGLVRNSLWPRPEIKM